MVALPYSDAQHGESLGCKHFGTNVGTASTWPPFFLFSAAHWLTPSTATHNGRAAHHLSDIHHNVRATEATWRHEHDADKKTTVRKSAFHVWWPESFKAVEKIKQFGMMIQKFGNFPFNVRRRQKYFCIFILRL